jgi:hypothetical protein
MIPKILEQIKPEFADQVSYGKLDAPLIGPISQHPNNTSFDSEPTRPVEAGEFFGWARQIRDLTSQG